MATIDLYCERIGSGLWAEPVNAMTNAAFLTAAWAIWRFAKVSGSLSPAAWLLIALSVAIGAGSALFHTVATTWARL